MTNHKFSSLHCVLLLCAGGASAVQAETEGTAQTLADALNNGDPALELHYHLERVDQENFTEDATASTLKTRLGWQSGNYRGFGAMIEIDDVSAIGQENYNSSTNGKTDYPVVSDPLGTEVNQAYVQYEAGGFKAVLGRQRINLDSQRFVGGAGWRQNEQTYDGYRFQYGEDSRLQLDYSYVHNVNRVFGENSENGDMGGEIHIFRSSYSLTENHSMTLLLLDLDLEDAVDASSRTLALNYNGAFGPFKANLGYARQTESDGSNLDYSAPYYLVELGAQFGPVNLRLGYEQLGADEGVAFSTPLAALHKFQGFADQFLSTPADGVEDEYLGITAKLGGGTLGLSHHQFSAAESSADWGDEWDLGYSRKLTDELSATVKYASYSADDHGVDTDKLWLTFTASF